MTAAAAGIAEGLGAIRTDGVGTGLALVEATSLGVGAGAFTGSLESVTTVRSEVRSAAATRGAGEPSTTDEAGDDRRSSCCVYVAGTLVSMFARPFVRC